MMKKLVMFTVFFIALMSCENDIIEEIPCVDSIKLEQPITGEGIENRSISVEDIYFKGDTIMVQSTKEFSLNQYRIVISNEDGNISGGYKWWYGSTTPSHLHRLYKIPSQIPDCYDNFDITFGIWDKKLDDYIQLKTINFTK
jgi:hypothetical protein